MVQKKNKKSFWTQFARKLTLPIFLLFLTSALSSQTYPILKKLGSEKEAPGRYIDASYKIWKCSATSPDEVYVNIFNEKTAADTLNLTIEIIKQGGTDTTTHNVTIPLTSFQMTYHECGSTVYTNLKFPIPFGYMSDALTVNFKFN